MPPKGSGKLIGAARKAAELKWFFPIRLQSYLALLGWRQEDLAELSGLSVSEINKILNGRRELRIESASRIVGAFEFSRAIQLDLLFVMLSWDLARLPFSASHINDVARVAEVLGGQRDGDLVIVGPEQFNLFTPRAPRDDRSTTEDWRVEFRRLVQLFGKGFFINPDGIRHEQAFDAYLDRVLRPAARAHPRAAWLLSAWVTSGTGCGLPRQWQAYHCLRRGRWMTAWGSRQPIHEGRITRPRKQRNAPRVTLARPLGSEEHLDIVGWSWHRDWEFNGDAGLDREVRAILDETSPASPLLAEELDARLWQSEQRQRPW